MNKKTAYYAHSKRKYNTLEEENEMAFIEKHFKGEVVCPNTHLDTLCDIREYLDVIKSTDCVYATEYNGFIGKGVFDECTYALEKKIIVWVVRKDIKGKFFVQEVIETIETNSFNYISFGCLITK
jgi:hypothetical protein